MSADLASLVRVARFTLRIVNVYMILGGAFMLLSFPWHLL